MGSTRNQHKKQGLTSAVQKARNYHVYDENHNQTNSQIASGDESMGALDNAKYKAAHWAAFLEGVESRLKLNPAERDKAYQEYRNELCQYMRTFEEKNEITLSIWYRAYEYADSEQFYSDHTVPVKRGKIKRILSRCKVLVLTANPIEKAILHYSVVQQKNPDIRRFFCDDIVFYVFKWNKYWVAHVHQGETGTNTNMGSGSTIFRALQEFTPNVIISLGVAFGIDYETQHIGDVLVSKRLLPYSENKRDEEMLKPNRTQDKTLDRWLQIRLNNAPGFIKAVTYGDVLTGGSVVSSIAEKDRICAGYTKSDYIIGGEMEGSALYQFANSENVPGVVIKGICDWGVSKNDIYPEDPKKEERFKDSLQAYAMSQAIEKCAMLLNDSEVFSESKHADIKILEKAQKTNRHWLGATALVLFLLVMMKLLRIWSAVGFASLYIPKDVILDMLPFLLISACLAAFLLFSSIKWKRFRSRRYNINREIEREQDESLSKSVRQRSKKGFYED